jgi:signal transduction histidine kinase
MMSSAAHEEKKTGTPVVQELKSVSHDVFNLMTVMYGLQETLQSIPVEDDAFSRALGDFNQVVTKMQQIGDRLLKLYREEGGTTPKA